MIHPLVQQLRFTRREFRRALEGVTDAEARRQFMPMNCISWSVGHMAWQEQRYWLFRAQGRVLLPEIHERLASGAPASTPGLDEMWAAWHKIIEASDPWLNALTTERLASPLDFDGTPVLIGSLLRRVTYHYWYHAGENMAIRQMLGHRDLPDFVGDIDGEAPYQPE